MRESGWHHAARLDELPEATLQEVRVGIASVLLVRRGTTVHACATLCPHKFTHLTDGRLDGDRLTCAMHTASFDLATGHPLPGQEWAGRLQTYPVRIREGTVEVQLPEL